MVMMAVQMIQERVEYLRDNLVEWIVDGSLHPTTSCSLNTNVHSL